MQGRSLDTNEVSGTQGPDCLQLRGPCYKGPAGMVSESLVFQVTQEITDETRIFRVLGAHRWVMVAPEMHLLLRIPPQARDGGFAWLSCLAALVPLPPPGTSSWRAFPLTTLEHTATSTSSQVTRAATEMSPWRRPGLGCHLQPLLGPQRADLILRGVGGQGGEVAHPPQQ